MPSTDVSCPPDGAHSAASARRRWWILAVLVVAAVMDQLDTTITYVAAPAVQADLGGGGTTVQWLAAGYTLAFAVCLITGGRLGDVYGRRRMYLLGAAGFVLASLACGLAADPGQLIAARVVQGVFGALLIPQSLGIIRSVFAPHELGKAFGVFAPAMGLASMTGPVLAGGLIDADVLGTGWRAVFLINVPIGVIALLAAVALLPRTVDRQPVRLDVAGSALVTIAAVLVVYPLMQGRVAGWPVWTWLMLAAGALVLGLFVRYERRTDRSPLIEPSLLRNRVYVGGLAVVVVFFGAVAGQSLVLNVYAQSVLHFSALVAGLIGLPLSAGILAAGLLANRLLGRHGRAVLHSGMAVLLLGILALAGTLGLLGSAVHAWMLMPPAAVIGVGMGLVFGPLFRTILGGVERHEVGSASGTLSAVQQFGGTLGIAGLATTYYAVAGTDPTAAMVLTALLIAVLVVCAAVLVFLLPAR